MRPNKILDRISRDPNDTVILRRAGHSLGDELPRGRPDILRRFRGGLARIPRGNGGFSDGYLTAMSDICAGSEGALSKLSDDDLGNDFMHPTSIPGGGDGWKVLLLLMGVVVVLGIIGWWIS